MPKLVARPSKSERFALANYYPAVPCSSLVLPAQRKVSEESIHSNSETADDRTCVKLSNNSRKMTRTSSSLSSLLCSLTPSTTESSSSTTLKRNTSSSRLKRPAPSACLVEMAADDDGHESTRERRLRGESSACFASPVAAADFADTLTSPPPLRKDSAEGWGYFVDTMLNEHVDDDIVAQRTFSGSSATSPYLPFQPSQPLKRRRIHSQAPRELAGFFLAVPTVDDTMCQLSSLSF
jgi:hypothetical protein